MKFEHVQVTNFESAFRGMRNPMNSHHKTDSYKIGDVFIVGKNDLELAQKLIIGGGEHRKFLRQIFVCVDISAPRYWWVEFDTYKVGTTSNSESTMHTLSKYPITKQMFELDYLDYNDLNHWDNIVEYLENLRLKYVETKDYDYFRKLKQALPESFIQKRTVTMNYENILNMYYQRKNHRLKEWSIDFVNFIKQLPYANDLIVFTEKC